MIFAILFFDNFGGCIYHVLSDRNLLRIMLVFSFPDTRKQTMIAAQRQYRINNTTFKHSP